MLTAGLRATGTELPAGTFGRARAGAGEDGSSWIRVRFNMVPFHAPTLSGFLIKIPIDTPCWISNTFSSFEPSGAHSFFLTFP